MNLQPFHHEASCAQCAAASDLRFLKLFTEGLGMLFTFAVVAIILYAIYVLVW